MRTINERDAYELFPRSTGGWDEEGNPVHGTFKTTEKALERVADMGFDTRRSRVVAIKMRRRDLAQDSIFQARFRREAQ